MSDKGKELWKIQLEFNAKFFSTKGGWPRAEDLVKVTKDFVIHIIKEITEILDELSFKMHRPKTKEVDRANLLEEIIDAQKFLFGLAQIWGFTWEEYEAEFRRKSMVVEQRFAQDQQLSVLRHQQCVIVDIDGVLAEYPEGFYEWIQGDSCSLVDLGFDGNDPKAIALHEIGKRYKSSPILTRERIKSRYRQSGAKANLRVIPGAKDFLDLIRAQGRIKIVLMTNRPYHKYYRIYPDTLEWLKKNDLPYDAILWASDKGLTALENFNNIVWAVDDQDDNIARFEEAGIDTIKVNQKIEATSTLALARMASETPKLEDLKYAWVDKTRAHFLLGRQS